MNPAVNPMTPTDSPSVKSSPLFNLRVSAPCGLDGVWDRLKARISGNGGPVRGFHLLASLTKATSSRGSGLLRSIKPVSQYPVLFSLKPLRHRAVKLTASCSVSATDRGVPSHPSHPTGGRLWAPQRQNLRTRRQAAPAGFGLQF